MGGGSLYINKEFSIFIKCPYTIDQALKEKGDDNMIVIRKAKDGKCYETIHVSPYTGSIKTLTLTIIKTQCIFIYSGIISKDEALKIKGSSKMAVIRERECDKTYEVIIMANYKKNIKKKK